MGKKYRIQPKIQPVHGSETDYTLLKNFMYYIDHRWICVPKGFTFNGASIPRTLWTFVGHPFSPQFVEAALVHDHMIEDKRYPRKKIDGKFHELLVVNEVNKSKAYWMHKGVRCYSIIKRRK